MKDSHYRISLDIHSTQSQVSLPVKQGDTSRKVFISLCEGGKPYHIEDDCFAVFSAKKPDNTIIKNNCVIADNVIEYTMTEQTTAKSGIVNCEINLYGVGSGLISSPHFTIIVDSRAVSDKEIAESFSDYSALTEMINAFPKFKEDVEADLAEGKNIVANALKGTASGNPIRLDDVSPVEHEISVKLSSDSITDFSSVTLKKYGKNIFKMVASSKTVSGVTFTANNDGSITFNGKAVGDAFFSLGKIRTKAGETYRLSGCPSGGSFKTYVLYFAGADIFEFGEGITFAGKGGEQELFIAVYDGTAVNNLTFYPMVVCGDKSGDYEPYKEPSTYNGTAAGVTSIYPTTTLMTDTEGVTIDVEYNRDANKVVAELLDIIINGKSFVTDVKIFASKWVGTASPYSQVVTVEGATSRSQVDLTPSAEQLSIFHSKDLAFVTENNNGVITVYAIGQKPMNDYTIQATVTEVKV